MKTIKEQDVSDWDTSGVSVIDDVTVELLKMIGQYEINGINRAIERARLYWNTGLFTTWVVAMGLIIYFK
jgi:hypothetical protein